MIIKWQKRCNGIGIWKKCQKRFNVKNRTTKKWCQNGTKKWFEKMAQQTCDYFVSFFVNIEHFFGPFLVSFLWGQSRNKTKTKTKSTTKTEMERWRQRQKTTTKDNDNDNDKDKVKVKAKDKGKDNDKDKHK